MKKLTLFCFSFFVCTVLTAQVNQKEKQALLDLYAATNGKAWVQTWDLNEPVSDWHGVTVKDNTVVEISLLFNNLNGILPASIGDLQNLTRLELSFNKLEGAIPSEIGNLIRLEHLAFNGNNLNGSIPESIGNLSNLKELHLSSNQLSGTVPERISNLQKMEVFNVFDNQLTGSLPVALAANNNLRELMIAENNFVGTEIFSAVLLSNSGAQLDLTQPVLTPSAKSIIAIETSDDEN